MTHTGMLIKYQRKIMKFRQIALARHLDITAAFVCRIENGACGLPTKYIEPTCQFLNLSKAKLIKAMAQDMEENLRRRIK